MRILIVDDSEQTTAALHSSTSRQGESSTTQSGIFAALSVPQIVMSRLTRESARESRDTKPNTPKLPDFASLHLENSPEVMAALLNALGLAYLANGRLHEAEHFIEKALELRMKLYGPEHPQTAASINSLARVQRDAGRLDEALRRIKEALSIDARVSGADSLASAGDLSVLASIEFQRSELTEAEHAARSALKIFDEKLHGMDPWVPYVLDLLARIHQWRADYSRAGELYRRIQEIDAKLYGREHPIYAVRLHNYATSLEAQGNLVEAKAKYDEALRILTKQSGQWHPNVIDALGNRGALLLAQGDFDGARRDFKDALERNRKVRGADHAFVGYDLMNLAQLAFDENQLDEALARLEEALEIFRAKLPPQHAYIGAALTLQGRTFVQAERPVDAEAPLEEAVRIWADEFGDRSPEHAIARATLARAWFLQGKRPDEIAGILRKSLAIIVAVRGEDNKTAQVIRGWLNDVTKGSG